jgi:hypothetical protein
VRITSDGEEAMDAVGVIDADTSAASGCQSEI